MYSHLTFILHYLFR